MSTPFTEILRRKRLARTPGFAGGDLEDQVQRTPETVPGDLSTPQSVPQVQPPTAGPGWQQLTPQNQQAVTRPRTVMPASPRPMLGVPSALESSPDSQRQRTVSFNPETGRPNEDYYQQRGDLSGLYNAYQNWGPHGGKRGFKNALKAGALMAAQSVAANPQDPVTAALAGFGLGAAGGAVRPNFKNQLVRGFKLQQVGGELKNQLALERERANIDASTMIPVMLDNGQQVMVPAKSAATLASRQQEIGMRGDTLEARKKRWDQLGTHEAARDAQALYNSGAADDSAELRAEIARRLGLPAGTALPQRGLGNQIKLDENGNYVVISPRSGQTTQTGTQSYDVTREAGRDQRAQAAQAGANYRAGLRGPNGVKLDGATKRRIAQGHGAIEDIKGRLAAKDDEIKRLNAQPDSPPDASGESPKNRRLRQLGQEREKIVREGTSATAELNALDPENEWGAGEGGYPYSKPRQIVSQGNGRSIEGAIDAFKRSQKRDPTADEIARMKAALDQ